MKRIAIAAALLVLGAAAQAQTARSSSPVYGELGYSFQQVDAGTVSLKPQALRAIVGYNLHPWFALEGMLAIGTSSDDVAGLDFKVDHSFGVFIKPKYDFNNFEVFGRLGWARTRLKVSGFGANASNNDNDLAYGVGVNYNFNPRTYVGLDYLRLLDKDGIRIDGWTVNVGYRF